MKQVIFVISLIAMVSFTGCLDEDDSSDTTSYKPSNVSTIELAYKEFTKTGNKVTSNCQRYDYWEDETIQFTDADSNVIWLLDGLYVLITDGTGTTYFGWEKCNNGKDNEYQININLPQEPVRVTFTDYDSTNYRTSDNINKIYIGTF